MSARILLSLYAFLLLAGHAFAQDVIRGRVVAVTDGDTIKVLIAENQLLRVRVAWIDALVFGKDVELRPHVIDRYGRTVAMVFVDGRDVGLELIKQGLAWAYKHYLPESNREIQARYTATEAAARTTQLDSGLTLILSRPGIIGRWKKSSEH